MKGMNPIMSGIDAHEVLIKDKECEVSYIAK